MFTPRTSQSAHASRSASDTFLKPRVQPKLAIGTPGDRYEVEADRTADKVVSGLKEPKPAEAPFLSPKPVVQARPQENTQQREESAKADEETTEKIQPKEEQQAVREKPLTETITPLVQTSLLEEPKAEAEMAESPLQKKAESETAAITGSETALSAAEPKTAAPVFQLKPVIQPKQQEKTAAEESSEQDEEIQEKSEEEPQKQVQLAGAEDEQPSEETPQPVKAKCGECADKEAAAKEKGETPVQTKCEKCEEKQAVQAKSDNSSGNDISSSLKASKGGGSPMSRETQSQMGEGFGADFSNVRIHTDANAVQMNKTLGSQAFANGSDIYFNEGKYDPGSDSGKHLLAHELTHTVQQGASGGAVQKKPEDYAHPEDGNQSMDGINEEVTDDLGEDKNIRNPQISAEERAEEKPPASEKGEDVDQAELTESAKPAVDRKAETQPRIDDQLGQANAALQNVEAPKEPEQKEVKKKEKKLSPKEQAAADAKKAYAKANRDPEKIEPKAVEMPKLEAPKDASGQVVQGNPAADAQMLQVMAKIQVMREQAARLKEGADQERIHAEVMRGDINTMYHGVYTSDEFIDKAGKQTETRRDGVDEMKTGLTESKARVEKVQSGLPEILEQSQKGKDESGPMAESAQERKRSNDNLDSEDEDAREEARERGGQLESTNRDATNIDDAITQTRDKAKTMSEEVVVASEQNTETETSIAAMDASIKATNEKLTSDKALNTTAKTQLAAQKKSPDQHLKKANQLDKEADMKLRKSEEMEESLNETYQAYHDRMKGIAPDPVDAMLQRQPDGSTPQVPDIQLTPGDGQTPSQSQIQQQEANNWYAQQVQQMDENAVREFDQMNALDKTWFGLKRTYYDIASSLSGVQWGKFTEDLIRGLVDPIFLVQTMGELFNHVTHPQHRPGEDPLTWLLREAAGWATGIAVVFGTIAGLCLIGMGVLAVINFWFPPTLIWSPPIYAELGALMSWTGSMMWATTQIALVLHALVFISDLIATAFSPTAAQLVRNSQQLKTDVEAASFPIITATTMGLFKALHFTGVKTGILRPSNAPAEGAVMSEAAAESIAPENVAVGDDIHPTTEQPRANETGTNGPRPNETVETPGNNEHPNGRNEEVPTNDGPENLPEDQRPQNSESANTVDGLQVESEFRGDDGHTRKVLEDGQVARCTFCERCRERFKKALENQVLRDYLERMEEKFRNNPDDPTLQAEQQKFEADLDAVETGRENVNDVAEKYNNQQGEPVEVPDATTDSRFDELSRDPQTKQPNQKSIDEAHSILQAEREGKITNPRRPDLSRGEPNLDFKIDGPPPYKWADIKTPVNRGSLPAQAKGIGEKTVIQKAGAPDVVHIIDLKNIPASEKATFRQNVINAAKSEQGIIFINSN